LGATVLHGNDYSSVIALVAFLSVISIALTLSAMRTNQQADPVAA
jgi:hypothetical protein